MDPEVQKIPPSDGSSLRYRKGITEQDGTRHMHRLGRNESLDFSRQDVNYSHFAGRIAGNQLFTLSPDSPEYQELKDKIPDAIAASSWRQIMDLRAFRERRLWEMAFIEGVGVCLQVWSSGALGRSLVSLGYSTPLVPISVATVVQFINISIFTFALGPVTGAHLNPLITMATFVVKLSSFARTVLYIAFQCIGAIIGAFILRGGLGLPRQDLQVMPGCYVDTSIVTPGEAFAMETMSSFFLLFLAFGLGLDPRNNGAFGPSLGPFLVGLSAALTLFTTGVARPGYLGASNNPARCLGLMAASGRWDYHYNHWFGDIAAVIINGIGYEVVPPFTKARR